MDSVDDFEIDKRVVDKLERSINRYIKEQRMLRKDSDLDETLEEVFDRTTIMTLYKLMNKGVIDEFHGVVSSGKEARVYAATAPDGTELAVKIYLIKTAEFRKGRIKYIVGDPRFEGIPPTTRGIVYAWASKEYKNLELASRAGVYVPQPIIQEKNVLIMKFIGKEFVPAPTLKELSYVSDYMFYQVIRQVRLLYSKANLVHADLSEYNIFYYKRKPILFDIGQGVLTTHPSADVYLVRDISNILNFFRVRGVSVPTLDDVIEYIKG
jgi:RIO kinase 1